MPEKRIRRRLDLRGQVQGVGFRPFVYRLATELRLAGHVANDTFGAHIEIEGPLADVERFEHRLVAELPPLAAVTETRSTSLPPTDQLDFVIHTSDARAAGRPEVTPDAATCPDCLRELFDPADRRYGYPFINCTNCGPRYSIIRATPYDRPATTMSVFRMCPACQAEYDDPADRRFHAQPNACPACGPHLTFERVESEPGSGSTGSTTGLRKAPPGEGRQSQGDSAAIAAAADLLRTGGILAVKGIGGYHLACRADDEAVVQRLRIRKLRDGKPLAIMVPDVTAARQLCELSAADERTLRSPSAPIVLAPRRPTAAVAASVAPGTSTLGLMLPYAPLHHLLFAAGLPPVVMTSANLAGQPLTYRDDDAWRELSDVADALLSHDREIFRPIDDAVVFTFRDDSVPVRRARGYAPRPLRLRLFEDGGPLADVRPRRILAVGGELKSTVCLLGDGEAIVSEHLGDLGHPAAYRHFIAAIERLQDLYDFRPEVIAHDLHPRYLSTEYAQQAGMPLIAVQHHHAHIASVMAEHDDPGRVIGLSCDGTGYGTDGAIWGCELLHCAGGRFERLGHLGYVPLVGGDLAAVENWRPAAALLRKACPGEWERHLASLAGGPSPGELKLFEQQLRAEVNCPLTSSLGRLFDAVAFLIGVSTRNRHEAEAALALEAAAAAHNANTAAPLAAPFPVASSAAGVFNLDPVAVVRDVWRGSGAGEAPELLAARFHETIAAWLATTAATAAAQTECRTVALSGGCFLNRLLLDRVVTLIEARGLVARYQRAVPPGDGGLSLGQALVAAWQLRAAPTTAG